MLSMSRISTAIWARFAASAIRVKSFRKTSVEGDFSGAGCGGTIAAVGDGCDEGIADVCCDVGDVMGAFIVGAVNGLSVTDGARAGRMV